MKRFERCAWVALAAMGMAMALSLAGCSSQREPAQQLLGEIEAVVAATSAEAAQYVPAQLSHVQQELDTLRTEFDAQDYAAVMRDGPAVMSDAHDLAGATAAQKNASMHALNDRWMGLAAAVPGHFTVIQRRIDAVDGKSGKKLTTGIDVEAATSALRGAASLWSKAQAAFAQGNLKEAVTTASDVENRLEELAAALQVKLTI